MEYSSRICHTGRWRNSDRWGLIEFTSFITHTESLTFCYSVSIDQHKKMMFLPLWPVNIMKNHHANTTVTIVKPLLFKTKDLNIYKQRLNQSCLILWEKDFRFWSIPYADVALKRNYLMNFMSIIINVSIVWQYIAELIRQRKYITGQIGNVSDFCCNDKKLRYKIIAIKITTE